MQILLEGNECPGLVNETFSAAERYSIKYFSLWKSTLM